MSAEPTALRSRIQQSLTKLRDRGLLRRLLYVDDRRPGELRLEGRWLADFTGNDYLGLAHHPACQDAAQKAVAAGCGSGGSRVVTGGGPYQWRLEERLRRWSGKQALVFPSGYQANLGLLTALCEPGHTIFSDQRNHASIVDGCRLSGAQVVVYPHCDTKALEQRLQSTDGPCWVVTDSVFSMDGSLAPVAELSRLCTTYGAALLVDEAHAVGVLGPGGRGLCAAEQVEPLARVGTFSKALGGHGAFCLTDDSVAAWLVNRARSYIYTTALPPAVLAAADQALALCDSEEGLQLRRRVLDRARHLRRALDAGGLPVRGADTPIVALPFDTIDGATRVQRHLQERGLLCWAFRPPTVEPGTSLLRISLHASHTTEQVDDLGRALVDVLKGDLP